MHLRNSHFHILLRGYMGLGENPGGRGSPIFVFIVMTTISFWSLLRGYMKYPLLPNPRVHLCCDRMSWMFLVAQKRLFRHSPSGFEKSVLTATSAIMVSAKKRRRRAKNSEKNVGIRRSSKCRFVKIFAILNRIIFKEKILIYFLSFCIW